MDPTHPAARGPAKTLVEGEVFENLIGSMTGIHTVNALSCAASRKMPRNQTNA